MALGEFDYRRADASAHELERAALAGRALELGVRQRGETVEVRRGGAQRRPPRQTRDGVRVEAGPRACG